MVSSSTSTLTIGVLLFDGVQLLDLSAVDLFAMCSKAFLRACDLPAPIVARGLDRVNVYYINEQGPSHAAASPWRADFAQTAPEGVFVAPENTKLLPVTPTLNLNIALTHNLNSAEVAPGMLDILLIPGPDPKTVPSEAEEVFMKEHVAEKDTDVLVICTGIFPMARAGLLNGRDCTGPRPLIDMQLRKIAPQAKWHDDRRWIIDRNQVGPNGKGQAELWTAGGISNGCDMVAAYLRAKLSPELGGFVCEMADVGDRGIEYGQGKVVMVFGFGWTLLRSWWAGVTGTSSIRKRA